MFAPLLLGSALAGVASIGNLVQHYRRALGPLTLADVRALKRTPVTPIGLARDGFVKLVGTLGTDAPIRSLYGDALVAVREVHHHTIEGSGASAARVHTHTERSTERFYVEDDTGRIGLDPSIARIDYELDDSEPEPAVEERRLRVGERVAVLGVVRRDESLAHHPHRRSAVQVDGGLRFVGHALVTWRTEPEVYPRLLPSAGGVALSASTVALGVLGAILQV